MPPYALVTTPGEAEKKATEIGFPLVAKVVSPEILHKTDVKGVKVGIKSGSEAEAVFSEMYDRLSKQYQIKGILLEKMVPPGIEIIIGLQNDAAIRTGSNGWIGRDSYRSLSRCVLQSSSY